MNDPTTNMNAESELAWLAEQYVLGELDSAARDALEERLTVDQAAREAIANAMQLLAAAHASQPSHSLVALQLASRRTAWLRSRNFWWAVTAACLVIGAFALMQGRWFEATSDRALANAWYETRETEMHVDSDDALAAGVESIAAVPEEIEAPDWLITAMSLHQEGALHQEGMSSEERASGKPNAGDGA